MTVTYIHRVPSADKLGAFFRLLALWKGGVLKGIWKDLMAYFAVYAVLSVCYRYLMIHDEDKKKTFERVCVYMNKFENHIPLPFLLGFYVTQVVSRWWSQFLNVPYVDGLASTLNIYLPGRKWSNTRRKIIRYALVSLLMVLKSISDKIDRKYKSYQDFVDYGLLTEDERRRLEAADEASDRKYHSHWVPMRWAMRAARDAYDRSEGELTDVMLDKIISEVQKYSGNCGTLLCYAWVNIPLVYTQIVTLAVHIYFGVALLGQQHLTPTRYVGAAGDFIKVDSGTAGSVNLVGYDDSILDFYVPIFLVLQYIFYFGWLQVAKTLINPFGGDDDDDFEVEYFINRNYQVGFLMIRDDIEDNNNEESELCDFGTDYPPMILEKKNWKENIEKPDSETSSIIDINNINIGTDEESSEMKMLPGEKV